MSSLNEPLQNLFTSSSLLILNFDEIPPNTPSEYSIQKYFQDCETSGIDPRTPENRQKFNDALLVKSGMRYLVSRYGEDRISTLKGSQIAKEGRTIHLGVDIFCKNLEIVYAPCDGEIIRIGQELQSHSFGYYAILKPDNPHIPYIFLGHLSSKMLRTGRVKAREPIATIGDYKDNENGGWSRHLHIQMLTNLPLNNQTLLGYSTTASFSTLSQKYPNPMDYFSAWQIN